MVYRNVGDRVINVLLAEGSAYVKPGGEVETLHSFALPYLNSGELKLVQQPAEEAN